MRNDRYNYKHERPRWLSGYDGYVPLDESTLRPYGDADIKATTGMQEDLFGLHGTEDEENEFESSLERGSRYVIAGGLALMAIALIGLLIAWVMIND